MVPVDSSIEVSRIKEAGDYERAEKLEALTALGLLNSRIKDYYDLALLARMYSF